MYLIDIDGFHFEENFWLKYQELFLIFFIQSSGIIGIFSINITLIIFDKIGALFSFRKLSYCNLPSLAVRSFVNLTDLTDL